MLYLSWQLEPVLLGGLVTAAVAYFLAVGPLRRLLAPGEKYPLGRATVFATGLLLLFLNEGSPLHDLAERYLLSAHMLQHLTLSYVVAPVMLLGIPDWLLRKTLLARGIAPVSKVLLNPVVTFFAFSLVMAIYHVPAFYDLSLSNTSLHHAIHLVVLFVSLQVWWPLIGGIPELPKPGFLPRLAYLFLLPVAQLPIFGGITFSMEPLYQAYASMPTRAFGLGVMEDQALAGIIMKVAGLFAFGITFIITFFNWYRSEVAPAKPSLPGHTGAGT
ncbi:MAG TPA: cytochrome c oxidase assembly protein [Trueperaceae bacterium]|nr:cytochrome c oxidase assembly protein [Trueperaceae bacterium]